jgi:hypothetical protein
MCQMLVIAGRGSVRLAEIALKFESSSVVVVIVVIHFLRHQAIMDVEHFSTPTKEFPKKKCGESDTRAVTQTSSL